MILVRVLVLFIIALSASAREQFIVRSGEHSSYSRLVFPVQGDVFWELRTTGRIGVLKLPTSNVYQIDRIFDRIPKTRLLSVSSKVTKTYSEFTLKLGCDCEVVAQIEQGNLILDVRDEATAPMDQADKLDDHLSSNDLPMASSASNRNSAQSTPVEPTVDADDLASILIEQIDRATELGYINPLDRQSVNVEEKTTESEVSSEVDVAGKNAEVPYLGLDDLSSLGDRFGSLSAKPNLSSSSIRILPLENEIIQRPKADRVPRKNDSIAEGPISEDFGHCLSDDQIDVGFWADDSPYSDQISQLQKDIFGEFDRPNRQGIMRLVQFYIYFGMGIEASSVLRDLEFEDNHSKLLAELASLFDDLPFVSHGILEKSLNCPGAVSLWSVLAGQFDTKTEPFSNVEIIVKKFATLPIHIRRNTGYRLIKTLLDLGFVEEADRVISIIDRTPGSQGDLHEISKALLLQNNGSEQEAESILWNIANTRSNESQRALLLLFDYLNQNGQVFPQNMRDLLGEKSFEYRGTDAGLKLKAAEILVTAITASLLDALEMIAQEIAFHSSKSEIYYTLFDQVLALSDLKRLNKAEFLNFALENRELFTHDNVSDYSKLILANYFLEIGLPKLASQLTQKLADKNGPESVNINAMIHLRSNSKPDLVNLLQNDQLANEFSIHILERMGRFNEAFEIAVLSSDEKRVKQSAWRSGNWNRSKEHSDSAISLLSKWMIDIQRKQSEGILTEQYNEKPSTFDEYVDIGDSSQSLRNAMKNILKVH